MTQTPHGDLFDDLLRMIAMHEWAVGHYRTLENPSFNDGVNNIIGSADALCEIQCILQEIKKRRLNGS